MARARDKAIVVGIGKYQAAARLAELTAVPHDMKAVEKILKAKKRGFAADEVLVLKNRKAKKDDVISGLKRTLTAAKSARVFVYLAGHGGIVGNECYFFPYDTSGKNLEGSGILLSEIREMFQACPSNQALLWLDFCSSGGIVDRGDPLSARAEPIKRALSPIQDAATGKAIIAACTGAQKALEVGKTGFMTGALVAGLSGGAVQRGKITANSLFDFVADEVENKASSYGRNQQPVYFTSSTGSLVLMESDSTVSRAKSVPSKVTVGRRRESTSKKRNATKWVTNSGQLALLGPDLYLPVAKVSTDSAGEKTVVVKSTSSELDAKLKRLVANRNSFGRGIVFAYQNEACNVRINDHSYESDGKSNNWTILLSPNEQSNYGHGAYGSIGINGQIFTALQVSEMRARKLLLDEEAQERGLLGFGHSRFGMSDLTCVFDSKLSKEGKLTEIALRQHRLEAISALHQSQIVEHVLELSLRPTSKGLKIRFSGSPKVGSNEEISAKVCFEGEYISG